MVRLPTRFGETVNLGVLDGAQIRYVDVRESRSRFRLAERVGGSDSLHCTALGKAHMAYLPPERVRELIRESGMPRATAKTKTTWVALKSELAKVHEAGYAVDDEESMEGAYCVGVPILDRQGTPMAALSVSGPTVRFGPKTLREVTQALLEAAAEIRARLGHA